MTESNGSVAGVRS